MPEQEVITDAEESGLDTGFGFLADQADNLIEDGFGESMADHLGGVPGIGQAVSGLQSAYHLGSAVYDGVTGDRDGAVAHGTQALVNAAMVVPGINDAVGPIDTAMGYLGTGAQGIAQATGHNDVAGDIPTGLDDIAANGAVWATNALFGADEDAGTGTREGEIGAGLGAANMMLGAAGGPVTMAMNYFMGDDIGRQIGSVTSPDKPTSGVEPGGAAQKGAAAHEDLRDYLGPAELVGDYFGIQ